MSEPEDFSQTLPDERLTFFRFSDCQAEPTLVTWLDDSETRSLDGQPSPFHNPFQGPRARRMEVHPGSWHFLDQLLERLDLPSLWQPYENAVPNDEPSGSRSFVVEIARNQLNHRWAIPATQEVPGTNLLSVVTLLLQSGRSPNDDFRDQAFAEAAVLRRAGSGQASLEERLRLAWSKTLPQMEDLYALGSDVVNALLRLILTDPRWREERAHWALRYLLERFPEASIEAEWILAASEQGLDCELARAAVQAARGDDRIMPALSRRLQQSGFLGWELEAYAHLALSFETRWIMRSAWRHGSPDVVLRVLREHDVEVARSVAEEMLAELAQAEPDLRSRILKALPLCPEAAPAARRSLSELGLANTELCWDALYALKALPDGPESLPLLLAKVRGDQLSWVAVELLVRGGEGGPEVAEALLAYLRSQTEVGQQARMALERLLGLVSTSPDIAERVLEQLGLDFRPTPTLLQLAGSLRPHSLPCLIRALDSQDPDVLDRVLQSLELFADQDRVDEAVAAIEQLWSQGAEHRSGCYLLRALGHLRPAQIPDLTTRLKPSFFSDKPLERRRATEVLKDWGAKAVDAAPLLDSYLQEASDADVQSDLRKALRAVGAG